MSELEGKDIARELARDVARDNPQLAGEEVTAKTLRLLMDAIVFAAENSTDGDPEIRAGIYCKAIRWLVDEANTALLASALARALRR